MKLNDDTVAALRCPDGSKDAVVFDASVKGFGVRVQANGTRTFLFRYKLAGVSRRVPLGTFGEVTTAKARKDAEQLRGEVLAGRDPWGERKNVRSAIIAAERAARAKAAVDDFTVKALIDLYEEKHVASLRPATRRDVLSRLRKHLAPIAAKPAQSIGRGEVTKVVDAAAEAGHTTARRVRDYARAMWGWAADRGTLAEGKANPWESARPPGKDVPRKRVLNPEETGLVWKAASTLQAPHGLLVRFALVTLARREEVTAMTWGEVAPDLSAWTQPGNRTKNGKPHVVYLSEPAQRVLRAALGIGDATPLPKPPKADVLVFALANNKPITTHSWVKRELDKAIAKLRAEAAGEEMPEPMPAWVLHDFRRSGVTWLAEAGFSPHVADRLLNHVQGTIKGVMAVYQMGEFLAEREAALKAWGAHVLACGEGAVVAPNVASLSKARARKVGVAR